MRRVRARRARQARGQAIGDLSFYYCVGNDKNEKKNSWIFYIFLNDLILYFDKLLGYNN